ncbi:MAG: radical SAM protein [Candidatus Hydrogenedentota bacterium]
MARVIMVYPFTGLDIKGVSVWLPLAILQVASTIVNDFDVVVIDQRVDDHWEASLRKAITDDTVCVAISSMTGTQIKGGLAASRVVRDVNPDLKIVWGGNHPTLVPESTVRHAMVDIVVMGEGEATFRWLVEAFAGKGSWKDVPDIAYMDGDRVVKNGTGTDPKRFVKQDDMPPLPYHLVDVEQYISGPMLFGKQMRSLPYISSQGCPYSCTFCCQPVLSSRRWRRQAPELLLERTLEMKQKFNLDAIEFHDEEFFVDRKRGAKVAEMIGGQYEWYVQTRMDDVLAMDCDHLYRNGLRVVQPGLETGSARILDMIKKEETLDEFYAANKKLAASGIRSTYNFMMGYPTETIEDLTATVDLALRLLDENPHASVSGFYVYVPYPGAELFKLAVQDGFEEPATLEGWSVFNRQHLASPWIQSRRNTLEMLLFTSKFIDGTRLKRTFQGNPLVASGISFFSWIYRNRWRKHNFSKTLDIDLLSYAAKKAFNW